MPQAADIAAGFRLTGFFLSRYAHEPRGIEMPEARASHAWSGLRRRHRGDGAPGE